MFRLSLEQQQSLYEEGYLVLRQVLPANVIADARRVIDQAVAADDSLGQLPTYMDSTFCPQHVRAPEIMALVEHSSVQAVLSAIFGEGNLKPINHAQIALRFPEYQEQPQSLQFHLDGFPTDRNPLEPNTLSRQTALLGIYLSQMNRDNMGNFVVWPKSHWFFQDYLRDDTT